MAEDRMLRKNWPEGTCAKYNGKVAKLSTGPGRDGLVRLEYADGTPPQSVHFEKLIKATEKEWDSSRSKAKGWDAKTWPYGTFVQAKNECDELVRNLRVKVKEGKVGRTVSKPDKYGQVSVEWPDGKTSGLIKVEMLAKVSKKEWDEASRQLTQIDTDTGTKQLREGRGAPAPYGAQDENRKPLPMYLSREHEMRMAFQMLDTDNTGELNRDQSRIWLRCMGWCVSDEDLDDMLSAPRAAGNAAPISPATGRPKTLVYSGRQKWTIKDLTDVVDQNRYKGNSSMEAATQAFKTIGNNAGKVSKDRLLQFTQPEHDSEMLEGGNLEEFLGSIRMSGKNLMVAEDLAKNLLKEVCHPPSVKDNIR